MLSQEESPTLEFKSSWYKLQGKQDTVLRQKAEMVKDILALANGSTDSAGETAILIMGADDQVGEDRSRALHNVDDKVLSAAEILAIVRSYSDPPLDSLEVVPFSCNEKNLVALVIPPTPHLLETNQVLKTPSRTYSEYVVLIRRGDSVGVASERERAAIRTLKKVRMNELRNPSAVIFGGAVGIANGALLLGRIMSRITSSKEGAIGGGLAGGLLGGAFGAIMGSAYEYMMVQTRAWRQPQSLRRHTITAAAGLFAVGVWLLSDQLDAVIPGRRDRSDIDPPEDDS